MNVVPPPPVNLEAIPTALRNRPQWVVWKVEVRDGRETKAPYQAREPFKRASSTQPGTWATFEEAVHALETHADDAVMPVAGLGYVFTKNDPFCGVDIDPDLEPVVQRDIIARLASYTERSPSGEGYHVLIRARMDGKGRHPPGIGVFTEGRYFTVTGNHVVGTPDTIEERQPELDAVIDEYLPVVALPNSYSNGNGVHPVDLEDEALLEKARVSRKGADFADLYAGRWEGKYSSQSEADLAFCSKLAFWTGRDGPRIDRIFRSSGLMRDKWEREDYRTRTLEEAIAGCRDVYVLPRARYEKDELSDAPDEPAVETVLQVTIEAAREFAAVEEPTEEAILGDEETCLLSRGGMLVLYGDGGAGKTTMELDLLFHLAEGREWQGLAVDGCSRILVIENEGPRGMFRKKIRRKLAAWDGDGPNELIMFLTDPWARFSFAEQAYQDQLLAAIVEFNIDIVAAGPVNRLGIKGGGTPDEVSVFVNQIEAVRQQLSRPVAVVFAHHENKAGDVSGAWEGVPDTLGHVTNFGHGQTDVKWEKVRWGPELHGKKWELRWAEGETFEQVVAVDVTNEAVDAAMFEYVREHPGCNAGEIEAALLGQFKGLLASRIRARRKEGVSELKIIETARGTAKTYRLGENASEMASSTGFQEFFRTDEESDPWAADLSDEALSLPEGEKGRSERGKGDESNDIDFGGRDS